MASRKTSIIPRLDRMEVEAVRTTEERGSRSMPRLTISDKGARKNSPALVGSPSSLTSEFSCDSKESRHGESFEASLLANGSADRLGVSRHGSHADSRERLTLVHPAAKTEIRTFEASLRPASRFTRRGRSDDAVTRVKSERSSGVREAIQWLARINEAIRASLF